MTYAKEKNTGEIYSWGLNNYYQLGNNLSYMHICFDSALYEYDEMIVQLLK